MKGGLHHGVDLVLHLLEPGGVDHVKLPLPESAGPALPDHGLRDPVPSGAKLRGGEVKMALKQEVVTPQLLFWVDVRVSSNDGHEAAEGLLLLCNAGRQPPDHGGRLDAGGSGHL